MHNHRNAALPVLALLAPACVGVCAGATSRVDARVTPPRPPARIAAARAYGRLPVAFEPNVGQTDRKARFIARGRGVTAFLTDSGAVLRASGKEPAAVAMTFAGANPRPEVTGEAPLPGRVNYLVGPRSQWKRGIPTYARARFRGVYPGVDVVYHRDGTVPGRLEYDFEVAPGADPGRIAVAFTGAGAPEVAADGALRLRTPGGELRQPAPEIYQEVDGVRRQVAGGYALRPAADGSGELVGFRVGGYDASRPLIIDPSLVYSTLLGGSGEDAGHGIAVRGGSGEAYVVGWTASSDFPATNPLGVPVQAGKRTAFVTKLAADGKSLIYSTYFGGSGEDLGLGIAVNSKNEAWIAGRTTSTDLPTTPGTFQPTYGGGPADGFVARLAADGQSVLFATYLGGSGYDEAAAIAVDVNDFAYVTGRTNSAAGAAGGTGFPTISPVEPGLVGVSQGGSLGGDAFVTKFYPDGSVFYSTYLGVGKSVTQGSAIAAASDGTAYIAGYSTFGLPTTHSPSVMVASVSQQGQIFAFFILHVVSSGTSYATGIDLDQSGIYVTGATFAKSFGYPTTLTAFQRALKGTSDAFVTKLLFPLSKPQLGYSTLLGGSGREDFGEPPLLPPDTPGNNISVGAGGVAYVTGVTTSVNFPVRGAVQTARAGVTDAFVTAMDGNGHRPVWSTYLGGSGDDAGLSIAADRSGDAFVTGVTTPGAGVGVVAPFPTTAGAFETTPRGGMDAFVTEISGGGAIPEPDLTGFWGRVFKQRVTAGRDQFRLIGTFTVQNIGNARSAPSVVRFFLSATPDLTNPSSFKATTVPSLPAHGSFTVHFNVVLPLHFHPQGMFVLADVDVTDVVVESNEDNNLVVFGTVK